MPLVGRKPLFALTLGTHTLFLAAVLILALRPEWLPLPHAGAGAFATVFGLSAVFALGDSVLETQLSAMVQSPAFLAADKERAAAVSNLKLFQSLGFSVQFGLGIAFPGDVSLQAAVLAPMMLLSLLAVAVLECCVLPPETPAADADADDAATAALGDATLGKKR